MALRLGLCCTFLDEPIHFRRTTVSYALRLPAAERGEHLRTIAKDNARALARAIEYCAANGIGAFRISSQLLPVATHPQVGYRLDALDVDGEVRELLRVAGQRAQSAGVRLSLHPDQFVVPGSATERTVASSLAELEMQAELAELVGGEQITLHGGGAQGGKAAALERLRRGLARLSERARSRVVLENDDRTYHVEDLLPLCRAEHIPLVYDVHHHRCLPDGLSVAEATEAAAETWRGREPWAHLSSPKLGWKGADLRAHAELIDPTDVPREWLARSMTIDVEAKAKERAVLALQRSLPALASPERPAPLAWFARAVP